MLKKSLISCQTSCKEISYRKSEKLSLLKNFRSHKAAKVNHTKYFLQRIFSTTNKYDAYYTPRHSTCSRLMLTFATVYFPVAKTANTPATAFEVNALSQFLHFSPSQRIDRKFLGSLSHTNASPTVAAHTFFIYMQFLSKNFHGSYSLRTLFPTSML